MLGFVAFALVTLAAARLTRIITTDQIGEPLRRLVWRLAGGEIPPALTSPIRDIVDFNPHWEMALPRVRRLVWDLVTCPWCIGFWISLTGIAGALAVLPPPPGPFIFWLLAGSLAASYLVGVMATNLE